MYTLRHAALQVTELLAPETDSWISHTNWHCNGEKLDTSERGQRGMT